MRTAYLTSLILALPIITACNTTELGTTEKKASYSIGVDFISATKAQGVEMDLDALIQGIKDASSDNKIALTDEEMSLAKQEFQKIVQASVAVKQKTIGAENLKAGDLFLKSNATKEGVITTKSGLQYKIIKAGKGATPKLDDTVVTHYEGRLIDGRVFDSSYQRNQPATFPLKGVIKGWTEALQLMKVGAKWQLYIPSDIAYGASQRSQLIQSNATLIFDIELLEIKSSK